jgi:hypothetical protein
MCSARYCADSETWKDANGNSCAQYSQQPQLQEQCFGGPAYANCPVACKACGDCCTASEGCFFFEQYTDGSLVSGGKLNDTVGLHGVPSGNSASITSMLGVMKHVDRDFEASASVDGVLGLTSGIVCNPSCSLGFLENIWLANPTMARLFALCLSGSVGSVDFGAILRTRSFNQGPKMFRWVPLNVTDGQGYRTAALLDLQMDEYSIMGPAANGELPVGQEAFWMTPSQLASYSVSLDSGTTSLMLPQELYSRFAVQFSQRWKQFGPEEGFTSKARGSHHFAGRRNTSQLFPSENKKSYCAGPIAADYDLSRDFPVISFVLPAAANTARSGSASNVTLRLEPAQYLRKLKSPDSMRVTIRGQKIGARQPFGSDGTFVCLGIQISPPGAGIVLGGLFLEAYYAVFDLEHQRLGLGGAANCHSTLAQPSPPPPPPPSDPLPLPLPPAQPQHVGLATPDNVAAPPAAAQRTRSGLRYLVLAPGRGRALHHREHDQVKVEYSGWRQADGQLFDSTAGPDSPTHHATFRLDQVIVRAFLCACARAEVDR